MVRLIPIIGLPAKSQTAHPVRSLEINGSSSTDFWLARWLKQSAEDYRSIMQSIAAVGRYPRVMDACIVKPQSPHTGIYEARAQDLKARLFFFYYLQGHTEYAVFVHGYEKGKGDQNQAFETARKLMDFCCRFQGVDII